jgi:hypothetical protein
VCHDWGGRGRRSEARTLADVDLGAIKDACVAASFALLVVVVAATRVVVVCYLPPGQDVPYRPAPGPRH